MNIAKSVLTFLLTFTIIAWVFGYINLNQDSYNDMTYQEQSQNIGSQFNDAVKKGTNAIKNTADTAFAVFEVIKDLITTIHQGIEKIAKFFGFDVNKHTPTNGPEGQIIYDENGNPILVGGGGFGGGGGGSW